MPNIPCRYSRDPTMVARKIGAGYILVPIRQNVGDLQYIYTLNEVASRIWELVDGGQTAAQIALTLTGEYEIDKQQAESDVVEFLGQMAAIGAIMKEPLRELV